MKWLDQKKIRNERQLGGFQKTFKKVHFPQSIKLLVGQAGLEPATGRL